MHFPMDLYYLENGLFALVTEEEQSERLKAVAEQISSVLTKAIQFEQFEIEMKPCICILRCPQ